MDDLRNQYVSLRADYQQTLDQASKEQNADKRKEELLKLIELNTQMSQVVSQMMQRTAEVEQRVDLTALNTHLSEELVRIQQDAQQLHGSRDSNEVLRRLAPPATQGTDVSVYLYLGALAVGLILVVLAVLQASFTSPAMPPLATPQLGLPGSTQW